MKRAGLIAVFLSSLVLNAVRAEALPVRYEFSGKVATVDAALTGIFAVGDPFKFVVTQFSGFDTNPNAAVGSYAASFVSLTVGNDSGVVPAPVIEVYAGVGLHRIQIGAGLSTFTVPGYTNPGFSTELVLAAGTLASDALPTAGGFGPSHPAFNTTSGATFTYFGPGGFQRAVVKDLSLSITAVPEPASLVFTGVGAVGLFVVRRRATSTLRV